MRLSGQGMNCNETGSALDSCEIDNERTGVRWIVMGSDGIIGPQLSRRSGEGDKAENTGDVTWFHPIKSALDCALVHPFRLVQDQGRLHGKSGGRLSPRVVCSSLLGDISGRPIIVSRHRQTRFNFVCAGQISVPNSKSNGYRKLFKAFLKASGKSVESCAQYTNVCPYAPSQ
jgi:hypothetical protein